MCLDSGTTCSLCELRTPLESRAVVERAGSLLAAGFGSEQVVAVVVVEAMAVVSKVIFPNNEQHYLGNCLKVADMVVDLADITAVEITVSLQIQSLAN